MADIHIEETLADHTIHTPSVTPYLKAGEYHGGTYVYHPPTNRTSRKSLLRRVPQPDVYAIVAVALAAMSLIIVLVMLIAVLKVL